MNGHNGISKRKSGLEWQAWLQRQVWVRIQNVPGEVTLGLENMCKGIADGDTHRGYQGGLAIYCYYYYLVS